MIAGRLRTLPRNNSYVKFRMPTEAPESSGLGFEGIGFRLFMGVYQVGFRVESSGA